MSIPWDLIDQCLQGAVVGGVAGGVICLPFLLLSAGTCVCSNVILGAILGSTIAFIISKLKVSAEGKAVLITGCDTGFGNALALRLNSLGFKVFAGCLDPNSNGAKELSEASHGKIEILKLNVTSDSEVREAAEYVKKHLPTQGLWAIVNNAGVSNFGEVEWVSLETYDFTFQVNVLGTIRVCKAFLPLLRKYKGRIINVASGLGRMAYPMRSPYVVSKYAVEGFTDCLRYEMMNWGVKVSVIEPGNFVAGTSIFAEAVISKQIDKLWSDMPEDVKTDYGKEYFDEKVNVMRGYTTGGVTDITPAINRFVDAILDRYPKARYHPMDWAFKRRCVVHSHFPEWLHDLLFIPTTKRQ